MKRLMLVLLLVRLLLCGCAAQPAPTVPTTLPPETEPPLPVGFYEPNSAVEQATGGAIRAFPLGDMGVYDMLSIGDSIVLFSYLEENTHLTVLSGEILYLTAQKDLPVYLSTWNDDLQTWDNGFSYFDTNANATIFLNLELEEVSRIPAPEGLMGTPLLSRDRNTVYYCTQNTIRALDLESGISRILRETYYYEQTTTALLLEDQVLHCRLTDQDFNTENIFLSTETGETLYMSMEYITVKSNGNVWYTDISGGPVTSCLFGQFGGEAQELSTGELYPNCSFLPQSHAAVISQYHEQDTILSHYDLNTGLKTSTYTITSEYAPWSIQSHGEDLVAFLNFGANESEVLLYLWDPAALPAGDTTCYTGPHYTWYNPDVEGLAACAEYAQELEEIHGVNILIYEEALEVQPWDYTFEFEYQPKLLMRELEQLDQRLQNYPDGFLAALADHYDSLNISLVRSIYGTPESGSLESANGLQFWPDDSYDAYIVMATGADTEYTLYHELCHLIDTVVINETNAYDQWDQLNPVGFSYDYDYIANQTRVSDEYLREEKRYFIDTYSMSFPKEDRARLMEYAMTEYNGFYFECEEMQAKLRTLCEGIRKAFGLQKSPETFLWEQYLKEPLAYTQ